MITALYILLFRPLNGDFGDIVYGLFFAVEVGIIEFPLWYYLFIEKKGRKNIVSAKVLKKLEKKR